MFENILRELKSLQGQKVVIPIHPDKDGYIDKECSDERCAFQFKVHDQDWTDIFKDHKVYCPMCRHEAENDAWYTTEQIEEGKRKVGEYIKGRINNALHRDADSFNVRQPKNSFLKISVKFTGSRSAGYIVPMESRDAMELKIQCRECNARYAVIGSAFFCPCCGHNSAEETFDNAIIKIETKIYNLSVIREALLSSLTADQAENTCRSLIETSLNDCVVAFQRFCEVSYAKKAPMVRVHMNAFQNLESGGGYWRQTIGESYVDWLTSQEFSDLKTFFQKRHLLAHKEGIVDQRYIDNSGDVSYKIGQRIVTNAEDISHCLQLVEKVITTLRSKI